MAECKIKHCDTVVDFNGEMITESAWLNNSVIQAEYVYIGGSSLIRCIYTIYQHVLFVFDISQILVN